MKIIADSHIPYVKDYFGVYGELILKPGRAISNADVKDADILLVRSITHVDQSLLKDSRVKFVGSVTAGADHLDTHWLDEAGIDWSVAKGFNAPPVADYVVSVIAALQRRQILSQHQARAAVIGVGSVGSLVVERLKLLNFEIILCDPLRAENETDFPHIPLDEIHDVDLISLHVPLVKHGKYPTYHFIDKKFIERQKARCILLNASRGKIVDSEALKFYRNHLHMCLDVWEHEPNIDKTLLESAAIATPHIAGYSVQSKMRGIEMIYQIVCDKKIIVPLPKPPLEMPHQQLSFAGRQHHWQDVVMGIFNPLVMTAMMRAVLLPAENEGELFDEMRNQFSYRHEFAYTRVVCDELLPADRKILQELGVQI